MKNIFDLTVKENRDFRRKHPRVWHFAFAYKDWRVGYKLTREEALIELEGLMSPENALRIAEDVDRFLDAPHTS